MYIIFGDEVAAVLREKHTVLQLETLKVVDDKVVTAYCVVPAEAIPVTMLPDLERLCRLHQAFVDAYNNTDYDKVLEIVEHVKGKFGADVDSFYDFILNKMKGKDGC